MKIAWYFSPELGLEFDRFQLNLTLENKLSGQVHNLNIPGNRVKYKGSKPLLSSKSSEQNRISIINE